MYIISYNNVFPDPISIPNPLHPLNIVNPSFTDNKNIDRICQLSSLDILRGNLAFECELILKCDRISKLDIIV